MDANARVIPRGRAPGEVVVLSKRTGNYIPDPTDFNAPLLDQLWVK